MYEIETNPKLLELYVHFSFLFLTTYMLFFSVSVFFVKSHNRKIMSFL